MSEPSVACKNMNLKPRAKDICEYATKNEWGPTLDCNHPKGDGFCDQDSCPKKWCEVCKTVQKPSKVKVPNE